MDHYTPFGFGYRLRHLGFTIINPGIYTKRYVNGMRLTVFTQPKYCYDHYILRASTGKRVFCGTMEQAPC